MNGLDARREEIRRQAYAACHELLSEYQGSLAATAYDRQLNLLVLAWLDGYGKMADWTKAELDASAERLTAAIEGLEQ